MGVYAAGVFVFPPVLFVICDWQSSTVRGDNLSACDFLTAYNVRRMHTHTLDTHRQAAQRNSKEYNCP